MITETEIKNLLAILASENYKIGLEILQNISYSEYKEILKYCHLSRFDKYFGKYFEIKDCFYPAPDYSEISELIQTVINNNLP